MGIVNFETFLITGILLNITPGNDTIFILSRSISYGKKAGMISALGIGAGCIAHTLFAAFGLSLIIAQSQILFTIIKFSGAAYLVFLGLKMLVEKQTFRFSSIPDSPATLSCHRLFRDAVITNLLNPKVALFFIAFLPQFIYPETPHPSLAFLLLGLTFICTGTIWCLLLAILSASVFSRFKRNPGLGSWLNRICGITLIALGIKVAATKQ